MKIPTNISSIPIEQELKQSYLDYAMSVIVGRALPDVRDGLKPVHRRCLFAMEKLSNFSNKPYKKSARIVGDVIGKYHPHGDSAVYDTIVRMAQPFSLRYLLVDGQGNFGSVDGDSAAAMRYTEVRMSKIAHYLLADLEKDTVDFVQNYDGSERIPSVFPNRIPNLIVNGSSGIAVGMATNIPPHNIVEVIDACIYLLEKNDATIDELFRIIPGPDFPTAGIINGKCNIYNAYKSGRGGICVRARAHIKESNPKSKTIIIDELPYQVNKAQLIKKIAELVYQKKIEGISDIRDESDKTGMRIVIELKRESEPNTVLNNLYKQTNLQTSFNINIVALDRSQPKVFNLKQILEAFIQHRKEVVYRRSLFELKKSEGQLHILQGLNVALQNIDNIVSLIKKSKTIKEAKTALTSNEWKNEESSVTLSNIQAQSILELRLHRLTSLEQDRIKSDIFDLKKKSDILLEILDNTKKLHDVIHSEFLEVKEKFGDKRRTCILDERIDLNSEDLIKSEDRVIVLSETGYIKSQSLDVYQSQHRGGRGKIATKVKDEDIVKDLFIANTHSTILCFSTSGKVYWLKAYLIPLGERTAKGRPIVNLLPLSDNEKITAILPIKEFDTKNYVFMSTDLGIVKKVSMSEFYQPRNSGKIAITLGNGERLVSVGVTDGKNDIMLISNSGKCIRFSESDVRPMGRSARGVCGMSLSAGQKVISLVIVDKNKDLFTATKNGYGQRTRTQDYRVIKRGGKGVQVIQCNKRNGNTISAIQVSNEDEMLMISSSGIMVRTLVSETPLISRNTKGVRLIQISSNENLVKIQSITV